jgi:hypothetical protein
MTTLDNNFEYNPSLIESLEEVKLKFHLIETSEIVEND